ncbi:ATP-binding cassette, subfamily B [Anaerocolumna jejuensis DSM 15929]|uniref:ATP-binding cassette, subfamily B n=1 Tax=Anaerocolumna jejuensis DSM 15929 TaxID=1121322 RepID=A0A1M6PR58_9FIRM|nr:ABC transporter ATP-binding protein [Anaerocolumna jejuensis]SHK10469.1 ATP-binding cassette, subfamily B [Anaerocolumna jejuensis DSM 15929]
MKSKKQKKELSMARLMLKMMAYRPGLYAVNCLLWAMIHVLPLVMGLLYKEFFQILTPHSDFWNSLAVICALTLAYTLGRMVNIYLGANADNLHRFTMSALLRRNMFESILKKPGAAAVPWASGEALNCFRDDADTIENTISWTLDFIGTLTFVVVAVTIMLNINVKITLLVFAPMVIVVGVVQMLREKLQKYREAAREATGMVTGAMGEIFGAVQAIKVAGEEEHVLGYLEELNHKRHKFMLRDTLLSQTLNSVFHNTVNLGTGFILLLAAGLMKKGELSIGDLSLFIFYLNFISDFTSFYGSFIANVRQGKISFERIAELMQEATPEGAVAHTGMPLKDAESKRKIAAGRKIEAGRKTESGRKTEKGRMAEVKKEAEAEALRELQVKGLTYLYESSGNGVEDVSFTLKKGSFTVITGRIGSGKSTLLKVLLGLLPAQKGSIYWNSRELKEPGEFLTKPHCAYTPQIPRLVSDTVRNNILFGLKEEDTDLLEALHSAVFEEDISQLEQGLDTVVGPRGVKLSGGQIQRVAVARMFARKASLMVFDDISSALDVETENKLWNRLFGKRPAASLVVSNRRLALKQADQIIVMKDGRVDAVGTLEELLQNNEEMQAIWG